MKTCLLLLGVISVAVALRVDALLATATHAVSPELIEACEIAHRAERPHERGHYEWGESGDAPLADAPPRVQTLHFDPQAWVIIDNGLDGLPGKAGVDDDFNGVVDDASERGAFGSDDQCHILPPGASPAPPTDAAVSVLSRGGFVPDDLDPASPLTAARRRWIVSGESGGKAWKFAINATR